MPSTKKVKPLPRFLAIAKVEVWTENASVTNDAATAALHIEAAHVSNYIEAERAVLADAHYRLERLGATGKCALMCTDIKFQALTAKFVREPQDGWPEAKRFSYLRGERAALIRQQRLVPYDVDEAIAIYREAPKAAPAQVAPAAATEATA